VHATVPSLLIEIGVSLSFHLGWTMILPLGLQACTIMSGLRIELFMKFNFRQNEIFVASGIVSGHNRHSSKIHSFFSYL
jgi:hypothetical protein